MSGALRILILEDLATDAELEEREVRKVCPHVEFLVVETRDDFVAALDTFAPDIVLSDFKLPQFDGLSALKLARENRPDTPFIVVTGSMDEDTAVKCMKAGAWDYVIKEHLKRLGPAVQNALIQKRLRLEQKAAAEKSRRWEQAFEKAQFGIAYADAVRNRFLEVNNTFARERGYTPSELIGQPIMTIFPPEMHDQMNDQLRQIDTVGHAVFEAVHLRQDKTRFPVLMEVTSIRDNEDRPVSRICYSLDITDFKATEMALMSEASRRRILIEQSRDGIVVLNHDGSVNETNKRFAEMLGYAPEEILKLHVWDWDRRLSRQQLIDMIRDVDENGDFFETRHQRKDGTLVDMEISTNGAVIDGRKLVFCVCRDITARKQDEKALRESEANLKKIQTLLLETQRLTKLGGWEYDLRAGRAIWTDEVYRIHGLSKEYTPGDPYNDLRFYVPEDQKIITHAFQEALERGKPYDLEVQLINAQGKKVWVRTLGQAERKGSKITRVFGNIMDITERKHAEAERERLITAINQAGDSIMITALDGTIEYVNPAFETITGYSGREVMGENPRILKSGKQSKAFYKGLWDTISNGNTWTGRIVNKRKDGALYTEATSISPVRDVDGKIVNYVAVKRDISGHLQLEEQFRQAQKMESVGRLAGGVAHDYNNILSVILGFTELALEKVTQADSLYSDLKEILTAAQRSRDITRQLLAFARKQTISPEILDLNETVENMLKILRRLIGEDIELVWMPCAVPWKIEMDPSQIDQILANLSVNARDAIDNVGRITIETRNAVLDKAYCAKNPGCVPGEYILLAVGDNGSGMEAEILENIFEPFFTTKETGKGTGLGLATVYGIVKQNKGFINVHSEPGTGTVFKIYLPRYEDAAAEVVKEDIEPEMRGSGETIMVVEDEGSILKLTRQILERLNYTVLTALTPKEALSLSDQYAGNIDLLLTDVVLPGMNGRELAGRLLSRYRDIKCLYMSGYTADVIAHRGVLEKGVNFIHKPFSPRELSIAVHRVLNQIKK